MWKIVFGILNVEWCWSYDMWRGWRIIKKILSCFVKKWAVCCNWTYRSVLHRFNFKESFINLTVIVACLQNTQSEQLIEKSIARIFQQNWIEKLLIAFKIFVSAMVWNLKYKKVSSRVNFIFWNRFNKCWAEFCWLSTLK